MSPSLRRHVYTIPTTPHPPPRIEYGAGFGLPLDGEEGSDFPPLQGEGKGGGGVNQMSIQLWTD